jgi:hypothetical protein
MASPSHDNPAVPHAGTANRTASHPRPGWMTRALQVLVTSGHRHDDRKLNVWLARRGGKFTDSVEREMERLLLGG